MDTLAPMFLLARTLATLPLECTFYPGPVHHQDSDRIIAAQLHGEASRRAGWQRPEGKAREEAIAELRRIATVTEPARRGALHPPRATLRTDLLGEVAGLLIGFAPDDHPEHCLLVAELLRDAGAEEEVVQRFIPIGQERKEGGGPAFSKAEPIGWAQSPRRPAG